jgi:hypothetical protein
MTKEEIELIADRVADKVVERLKESVAVSVHQDPKSINREYDRLKTCVVRDEEIARKWWKELYDYENGLIGGKNET